MVANGIDIDDTNALYRGIQIPFIEAAPLKTNIHDKDITNKIIKLILPNFIFVTR